MSQSTQNFVCHGCATAVDIARDLPFACPKAGQVGDDTDHVLVPQLLTARPVAEKNDDPFIRYRHLLSPYRLSRFLGLPDEGWLDIVSTLENRLETVDGRRFRLTPMWRQQALADTLPSTRQLWVKDETGNVAGSHKGRH